MALLPQLAPAATNYVQTNLVADVPGAALVSDPNLVGTWGMSTSTSSPFWVSNTSNGTSTLYTTNILPTLATVAVTISATVAHIPPSKTSTLKFGLPSGQVQNEYATSGNGFAIVAATATAAKITPNFIFASLDGTLSGWSGSTDDVIKVDKSTTGASYTGLALGLSSGGAVLYGANFGNGTIDVFDTNWAPVTLPGGFRDPDLPAGFLPTNIQRFGHRLYVTYGLSDGHGSFLFGPGMGAVNAFDLDGNLLQRLVGPAAVMNVPWGLALAGPNFGIFSYALLVGNFGDGSVSAFDPVTGNYLGTMQDGQGHNIAIDGLWGLQFGNGGNGGEPRTLYFAAAPAGGTHGLFGALTPAADSNTP
jgi:uncharacterized protein (TIGR03118 family)